MLFENYGSQNLPLLLQNIFLISGKNVFYDQDKNQIMVNATSLGSQDPEMSVSLMLTVFRRLTTELAKKIMVMFVGMKLNIQNFWIFNYAVLMIAMILFILVYGAIF